MTKINTKFGLIRGAAYCSYHPDGSIKELTPVEENLLKTPWGDFIPQYQDDGIRRRRISPLSFYPNGNLKNLTLQSQVKINTSIGVLPAEFVSFYENGSIKRIIPLHGQLSGFWSEEDEYDLAQDMEINLSFTRIKHKLLALSFYETGALKAITLWPKERVSIKSPGGPAEARIGITLHPDGALKSFEPAKPMSLETAIGEIIAFDTRPLGIHGEANSLGFSDQGELVSLACSRNVIRVIDREGGRHIYQPGRQANMFNPEVTDLVPMNIEFLPNKIRFNNSSEETYDIKDCTFSVEPLFVQSENSCSTCSSCTSCAACG